MKKLDKKCLMRGKILLLGNKYKGMTMNERLYASNLIDKFDIAVKRKNVATIISILEEVELTEKSIVPVLENLKLCGETYQYKKKLHQEHAEIFQVS